LTFAINPDLDPASLASRFAQSRRIQIRNFLTPAAADALHDHLLANPDWRHVINSDDKIFEAAADDFDAMQFDQRRALDTAMFAAAAQGFQFQYDSIRVPDDPTARQTSGSVLNRFASFLSSVKTLDFLRRVSGQDEISFADAQATRYRAGDFLTRHDDAVAGKDRVLAYVMNLSRGWRAEWGGLLLFNDEEGGVIETLVPRFNSLCLFTVPQPHSVSYVAPYATEPRLSVTGWLRTKMP
jgi:Rps23 Pro-64 3,4-dihydroxylase Tpa1-like proline 4-hydroxylase